MATQASSKLPQIVLVHGAWHQPSHYSSYIKALEARGFTVHCPHLPSCNGARPPTKSLPDDIQTVQEVLAKLIDAGEKIVLVMHSYGGLVGTDAASKVAPSVGGLSTGGGSIIKLVYLAAYILPPGDSVLGVVREAGVEHLWPVFVDDHEDDTCFPKNPGELFYHDLDKSFVDEALPNLVAQPLSSFREPSQGHIWKQIPAIYVYTVQDHTVPTIYQDLMLKKVKEEGIDLQIETYDTGHTVFVSKEKEMVDLVEKAAATTAS